MARTLGSARFLKRQGKALRGVPPLPPPPPTTTTTTRVLRSQIRTAVQDALAAQPTKITKPKRRRRLDPWAPKRKVNPNPTPRPREPPPTHFTCRICVEEQTIDQFPAWIPPQRNSRYLNQGNQSDVPLPCILHLARNPRKKNVDPVCKICIGNAMSARIDTLGARAVQTGCLEPGCANHWNWDYIMTYMPKGEPLEKFNIEMMEVWKQDVSPKPVTCPGPNCEAVGLPDITAPGYPQVTCNECKFRSCTQCHVPWHKDETCAERAAKQVHEKMSDPEKDSLKLMQTKDAKRCPNCQLVIEKDGGCDSMYCSGCQKYFNWATAASAIPGSSKALHIVHGNPYWFENGPVVCETDAIENSKSALSPGPPTPAGPLHAVA